MPWRCHHWWWLHSTNHSTTTTTTTHHVMIGARLSWMMCTLTCVGCLRHSVSVTASLSGQHIHRDSSQMVVLVLVMMMVFWLANDKASITTNKFIPGMFTVPFLARMSSTHTHTLECYLAIITYELLYRNQDKTHTTFSHTHIHRVYTQSPYIFGTVRCNIWENREKRFKYKHTNINKTMRGKKCVAPNTRFD